MRFTLNELIHHKRKLEAVAGIVVRLPYRTGVLRIENDHFNELKVVYLGNQSFKLYHPDGNLLIQVPYTVSGKMGDDGEMMRPNMTRWLVESRDNGNTAIYSVSRCKGNSSFEVKEVEDLDTVPFTVLSYIVNQLPLDLRQ